jgi:hypothetical protein
MAKLSDVVGVAYHTAAVYGPFSKVFQRAVMRWAGRSDFMRIRHFAIMSGRRNPIARIHAFMPDK